MTTTSKGLFITALGAFIMSLESLFIKLTTTDPYVFSFYIGLCMFISMAMLLIYKRKNVVVEVKKPHFKIVFLGTFFMALANMFFIMAIKNTLAANVVLIIATAPLFTTFFAYLIYKIKPEKNIFVASAFIFLGLYIIFSSSLGLGNMLGNIYAVLCTALFSIFFVFLSKYKEFDRTLLICIAGLLLSFLTYLLSDSLAIKSSDLVFVLIMGLLITPISRLLITQGTKFISASEASLLMIIETVMAPLWVWLFLREVPTLYTLLGGAIILLTLIVNSLYTMKK